LSVWYVIPSARPPEEAERCLAKWRAQGYKIALWRDEGARVIGADWVMHGWQYPGYARAVNVLAKQVLEAHPDCDWIVTGGDDVDPDPNHTADEIARQCSDWRADTFGVMQPTGDRFAGGSIDRIAGSPWMGREWCQRINQGHGPLWPEYTHNFVDEELQNVAIKYGVFWQRPDLIHLHHHFQRESDALDSKAVARAIPAHLKNKEDNPAVHWTPFKALFNERKRAGFPGSEPL
jgi:hypothetical protein